MAKSRVFTKTKRGKKAAYRYARAMKSKGRNVFVDANPGGYIVVVK